MANRISSPRASHTDFRTQVLDLADQAKTLATLAERLQFERENQISEEEFNSIQRASTLADNAYRVLINLARGL